MFYFRNKGTLPLAAITTLGISVKESDDPIGRFGTGLKYTIAGALRLNQEISIETGGQTFYFSAVEEEVRGKKFHIVHMTEFPSEKVTRLGFTTELGKHWKPWMYIRELYSNMKDEGGFHEKVSRSELLKPEWKIGPDETRIICSGDVFDEAYSELPTFILSTTPVHTGRFGDLHKHLDPRKSQIFYQGIKVGEFEKSTLYDVNITSEEYGVLTEDRTILSLWYASQVYSLTVLNSTDTDLIESWFTAKDNLYESVIGTAVGDLGPIANALLEEMWEKRPFSLNPSARRAASELFKPDKTSIMFDLSPVEKTKFERALTFIKKLGYTRDLEWIFVDPEDNETYGFVSAGKVYLCRSAFSNGTAFLAQVMVEEYLHYIKDLPDYSREMQNELFARIISLGEELYGVL